MERATGDSGSTDISPLSCDFVAIGCSTLSMTSSTSDYNVSWSQEPTGGDDGRYRVFYQRAQLVTGLFLYPAFCLFGLVGNCLTIIVLRGRKLRSVTSTFLIALSISDGVKLINDLFYFVVVLLLKTAPTYGELALGYMYPYAHYFFNASLCVTAWLTVSLAAERYILVCHVANAKQWCNVGRAQLTITAVFFSMTLFSIPFAFRYRTVWTEIPLSVNDTTDSVTSSAFPPRYSANITVTELWSNRQFAKTYSWIQNILRSIVPLLIMSTLNCFIVDALRRSARHVTSSSAGYRMGRRDHHNISRRVSPRNRRVTLMLVAVIVVFIVCVTPDAVMSTVFGFGYYDESSDLIRGVREITDFLLLLNSASNFMLYCAFNSVFRHHFRSLIVRQFQKCCCCCRQMMCPSWTGAIQASVALSDAQQMSYKSSAPRFPLTRRNIRSTMLQEPVEKESLQDQEPPASEPNGSNGHAMGSSNTQRQLIVPRRDDVDIGGDSSAAEDTCKRQSDVPEVNVKPVLVDIHLTDSWDCLTVM